MFLTAYVLPGFNLYTLPYVPSPSLISKSPNLTSGKNVNSSGAGTASFISLQLRTPVSLGVLGVLIGDFRGDFRGDLAGFCCAGNDVTGNLGSRMILPFLVGALRVEIVLLRGIFGIFSFPCA